jgi:ADP-ribose pyrophosphatase
VSGPHYPVVASTPIYHGRILSVRKDDVRMSDGAVAVREVVEHPGAVAILALDADGRVVLVHQYRHPVRTFLYELPAGLLDMPGEAPLAAARRELFEETGLVAADWSVLLDIYTSPGMSDEVIRIYLARGISESADRFQPEAEEITMTVVRLPLDDAVSRVQSGQITNAAAVAGICAAALARDAQWRPVRPTDAPWPGEPGRAAS